MFLLANLGVACYDLGTIWAHAIETFKTWAIIGSTEFHDRGFGSSALVVYHPTNSPRWVIGLPTLCQGASVGSLGRH